MMKKNITTICGSTRQNSTNHKLLKAIGDLFTDDLQFNMYEGLPPYLISILTAMRKRLLRSFNLNNC